MVCTFTQNKRMQFADSLRDSLDTLLIAVKFYGKYRSTADSVTPVLSPKGT
jgi:hypothetical protein